MPSKENLGIIFSLVIILGVQLYINACGIGFTYDSYDYLNASQNLQAFLTKKEISGQVINRPPFYPMILALVGGKAFFIPVLHGLFFISSFFVYARVQSLIIESTNGRIFGNILFATSLPLHIYHAFIWTESLYMLLLLGQFLILLLFAKNPSSYKLFTILLILGILSVLTKRGGILMLPGFSLSFFALFKPRKALGLSVSYFALCFLASLCWEGYWGRTIEPSMSIPLASQNSWEYLNVISSWVLPLTLPMPLRIGLVLSGLLVLIYLLLRVILSKKTTVSLRILAGCLIFLGYTLLRWKFSQIDYHESDRYLSVVFPFFLLFVIGTLLNSLVQVRLSYILLYGFFAIWMTYSVVRLQKNAKQPHHARCNVTSPINSDGTDLN